MSNFQKEKQLVRDYQQDFDKANDNDLVKVLTAYTTNDYHWRGMHPFYEQDGAQDVIDSFWKPLKKSFKALQRREDIFFAGANVCENDDTTNWVVSVGNFLGLFDENWLGIPSTGKMVFLRYAEFHRVENDKIVETALFCDVLSVMNQAGHYPLLPMTGASFITPGPRTHDGLLYDEQDPKESRKTLDLVHRMVDDLTALNKSGENCPPELLAKTWHEDMIWYGPTGIGATFTIPRYQKQHQYPFRDNLTNKVFNGHIARFGEGNYCGFFGWPNLNNTNKGGFLGMTANQIHAPMRVVDIYRREGDKLAENWVYIDILHYLSEQGLDVLERMKDINRT